jgi:tRNA-binding protein
VNGERERGEPLAAWHALDLRAGTVRAAELHPAARPPALVLRIDFGPVLGVRQSSARIAREHRAEDLIGRQVICAVNLGTRRVAGVESEVLVLAAVDPDGRTVLLAPIAPVADGSPIA